ncbi:MAG: glycosyltransferase [Sphingobacteriaceae bacterium]|nr:glycosyltransferase [Sphingobacteriaceae bacterium]
MILEKSKAYFTIIIPTLNSEATLQECLISIFEQSFQNFEIIIVDGHSSDQTQIVANNFGSKVKILEAKTKGIYNAMNEGIDIATGEWVYFLGSDDKLYNKQVLKNVHDFVFGTKVQLVNGTVMGTDSKKVTRSPNKLSLIRTGFHHQAFFYSKTLFDNNTRFDAKFKVSADYYFTLVELLHKKRDYGFVDSVICEYGEKGFSSANVDYLFFSKHYAIIKDSTKEFPHVDFSPELMTSINCCLHLTKEKQHALTAWASFMAYFFSARLNLKTRLDLLSRMIKNTVRFW